MVAGSPHLTRFGSDEARAFHRECPPVDLHADPLLWAKFLGYRLTECHRPPLPWAWFGGHTDLPRMLAARLGLQIFGLVSLPGLDRNLRHAVDLQIDLFATAVRRSQGALHWVRGQSDLERCDAARAGAQVGGLLAIEGAHVLGGSIDVLEHFLDSGVRALGLLHLSANACGAPAWGRGADADRGLTHFGREVMERCEQRGALVDLAHINRRGFLDACNAARKPLMVSHAGLAGVHPMWRNIDDEQVRAVAETGGVVGVIFVPYYLGADGIDTVVRHLLHLIRVGGEDAAALGSDWDGFVRPTRGLEEAHKLPLLTDSLLRAGLARVTVAKVLRGNARRVLGEVLL